MKSRYPTGSVSVSPAGMSSRASWARARGWTGYTSGQSTATVPRACKSRPSIVESSTLAGRWSVTTPYCPAVRPSRDRTGRASARCRLANRESTITFANEVELVGAVALESEIVHGI